jgi:hypothetical protein
MNININMSSELPWSNPLIIGTWGIYTLNEEGVSAEKPFLMATENESNTPNAGKIKKQGR